MSGHVLIVGAGIAGLALRRALVARGVPCTVVDRAAPPTDAGLGLNLPGNAVRALGDLGIADQVAERGRPIRRREYRSGSGRLLFAVDEEAFWGAPTVCIRRGALLQILLAGSDPAPRWNTGVEHVEQAGDTVRVELDSGQSETYDFVVGADGVRSTVRPAVSAGVEVRSSLMTEASWRFVGPDPGIDCWTVWSGADATFLLIPVAPGLLYGYGAATRGGSAAADPAWLAATFAEFPAPVPAVIQRALADPAALYHSPVQEVRCPRWSSGRLAVIGDAAHATAPVWAQGAALALEDALVLASLLAGDRPWTAVGAEFDRRRRPRVDHVQSATDRMSRLARVPIRVRDLLAPLVGPMSYRAAYTPLRTPIDVTG